MNGERNNLAYERERVRELVRALGEVPASPAFRERLRSDFVRGDIARQQVLKPGFHPGPFAWLRRAIVPAAAALVAVLLLVVLAPGPYWKLHSVAGRGQVAVNGVRVNAADVDRLSRLIRPGARVSVSPGVTLDLVAGDVLLLELDNGGEATVPQNPSRRAGGELAAEVSSGELRFSTGPGFGGRRFNVSTPDGLVEVTGTVVSVVRMPDLTCVCVLEGEANIGRDAEHMDLVPAGQRKVMFSDGRPPMISEAMAEHIQGLESFVERNSDVFD